MARKSRKNMPAAAGPSGNLTEQAVMDLGQDTKMRNIGGIAQTEAQKSSDLYMKCRYLDDVICCEL